MNHINLKAAGLIFLSAVSLTGCVDDKYDLSDIDTLAGIKVNDLVVPVNIDAITLSSVIDIKEGESIQIVDGEYAVLKTGDFTSSDVNIKAISMEAPSISNTYHDCPMLPNGMAYEINSLASNYTYSSSDVTDCVVSIEELGTTWTINIDMSISGQSSNRSDNLSGSIDDLEIFIPKGLTLADPNADYNKTTGVYKVGTRNFTNGKLHLEINATALNADIAGIDYDYTTHTVKLNGSCGINHGIIHLNNSSSKPQMIHIEAGYSMSRIYVTSFTGEIKYDIDNCDFQDVDLSSLPDFLSQPGTDLKLSNPQIYLTIDNPLNKYELTARTGVTIEAYGADDILRGKYSLDAPGYFTINTVKSENTYQFCLSPSRPDNYYVPGNTTWVGYAALRNVLSGDGLPNHLSIGLDNPVLPVQHVSNLRMDSNLGAITGKYTFFSPLSLGDGSRIVYSDSSTGWSSEDLDAVTISSLTVTALADSDLPVNAKVTAYPIDKNGNIINNVEITGADIRAMTKGQPITLVMTGEVKMLDGVRYTVTVDEADNKTLTPEMSIKLNNIRAKVSGEYVKKL